MPATIKMIAEKAGVSRGTVDRVLNNRGNVNQATEKRILRIAKQLGYTPNQAGRALAARKKGYVIDVILCSLGNEFFDDVKNGLARGTQEAENYGIKVNILEMKGYDVSKQLELLTLSGNEADLIILNAINDPLIIDKVKELREMEKETILINTSLECTDVLTSVCVDYIESGATAAGLMGLMLGKQADIVIAMGAKNVLGHNERVVGFIQNIKRRHPEYNIITTFETKDDAELAYDTMREVLTKHPETSGVYITSGGQRGVCRAIEEACRDDIIVVTSDGTATVREYVSKGIIRATVMQEPERQGYEAMHAGVYYLIYGELPESAPVEIRNEIYIEENL
ncbi:MAG: LacI family DNA-binding transcriptional regulator [Lachnospiraceae bacterium]|nr:LacI family DNA-binding transcriptional regulator [Lachnospiraceae bacterium]